MATPSLREYTGSPFIEGVKPNDVRLVWDNERRGVSDQPSLLVVSRPGEKLMPLGAKGFFLETREFSDGASILRNQVLQGIENKFSGAVVIANLQSAGDVFNIVGAGRRLRQAGVEDILLVVSRLYGQRQDDIFNDQTVTSFDVLWSLARTKDLSARKLFRRLAIIEPHSSKLFQQASILGLPTIGLSAYRWMVEKTGLRQELDKTWGVLGPDKGRHTTAHLLARDLGLEVFSFSKQRDRDSGKLKLVSPENTLNRLRQAGIKKGIMFDDELQSGSTTHLIAEASGLEEIVVLATHSNFSEATNGNLSHPAIKRVIVTNAMNPAVPIEKLRSGAKFEILDVWPSLINVSQQLWKGELGASLPEGWVLDPWFT